MLVKGRRLNGVCLEGRRTVVPWLSGKVSGRKEEGSRRPLTPPTPWAEVCHAVLCSSWAHSLLTLYLFFFALQSSRFSLFCFPSQSSISWSFPKAACCRRCFIYPNFSVFDSSPKPVHWSVWGSSVRAFGMVQKTFLMPLPKFGHSPSDFLFREGLSFAGWSLF